MNGIQGLGWIVLPCKDVALLHRWYTGVLGLRIVKGDGDGFAQYDLGQGMILELTSFSRRDLTPPRRFFDRDAAVVLRVYGVEAVMTGLQAKGVPFISDLVQIPNGRLAFFHDPEGHVWAIQERDAASDAPEDVAARQRWEEQWPAT